MTEDNKLFVAKLEQMQARLDQRASELIALIDRLEALLQHRPLPADVPPPSPASDNNNPTMQ
jgi:hypothetical protein